MFLLKPARSTDVDAILELARYLDSPNLPADRARIGERLERSERAFGSEGPPQPDREFQLVLLDEAERVVGTCAILSKHGTPEMPHIALQVRNEERVSSSLEVRVEHRTLELHVESDGPTELGALVLRPEVRGRAGKPGLLLSWGRFTYIARHPHAFERRILAEMRASFDEDGRSAFWHAFGERFTGISYEEADRRSATDKSFILDLFPTTPFYASLLDDEALAELGQVHEETRPALRLLERAGLQWIGEIDPFDAGPFIGGDVSQIHPIRETRRTQLTEGAPSENAPLWIAASEEGGGFRAVITRAELDGGSGQLPKEVRSRLRLSEGDELSLTPLPTRDPAPAERPSAPPEGARGRGAADG